MTERVRLMGLVDGRRRMYIGMPLLLGFTVGDGTRFERSMAGLLCLAAIRSGAARWQHSWTGPSVLVGADGSPLT